METEEMEVLEIFLSIENLQAKIIENLELNKKSLENIKIRRGNLKEANAAATAVALV
jgi:hypothetical protein